MSRTFGPIILGRYNSEKINIELTEEAILLLFEDIDPDDETETTPVTRTTLALQHEIVHWYQDIGTPLGAAFHWFHSTPIRTIGMLCNAIHKIFPNSKIQLPLSPASQEILNKNSRLADLIAMAASYTMMWDILDGARVYDIEDVTWSYAALLFINDADDAIHKYWKDITVREKKKSFKEASSPSNRYGIPIGAQAIQEGHARAVEDMNVLIAGNNARSGKSILPPLSPDKWHGIYILAINYMADILEWPSFQDMTKMEIFNKLYEFSAVCDLAMASPLSPRHFECWDENYSWKDFHPGWRFHRLCHAIKYLGIQLRPCEIGSYNNFISELTDHYHWKNSIEIFSSDKTTIGYKSVIEEISNRFLQIRVKYPDIMVNPFSGPPHRKKELSLAVPLPPLVIMNRKQKIEDRSNYRLDPPLTHGNLKVHDALGLEGIIMVEKYFADLAQQILCSGFKPENVHEGLQYSETIRQLTGLPEECFLWRETI